MLQISKVPEHTYNTASVSRKSQKDEIATCSADDIAQTGLNLFENFTTNTIEPMKKDYK